MNERDPRSVVAVLLYGTDASRRELAVQFLAQGDATTWKLLANTVRSDDRWLLRARCLEVLGLAAANGPAHVAEIILRTLLDPPLADGPLDPFT
jgi:hypothetical protein